MTQYSNPISKETLSPSNDREKNKTREKVKEKLKFLGVICMMTMLCAGFIWYIFKPDESEITEGSTGINLNIPEAITVETETDKIKIYEEEQFKKRQQEKMKSLNDLFSNPDTVEQTKLPENKPDAIKEARNTQREISRQITTFYTPPKEDPRVKELEKKVKELSSKLEREQIPTEPDPVEMMEKSYELAARYFPTQGGVNMSTEVEQVNIKDQVVP